MGPNLPKRSKRAAGSRAYERFLTKRILGEVSWGDKLGGSRWCLPVCFWGEFVGAGHFDGGRWVSDEGKTKSKSRLLRKGS